ncbi:MAG: hypothetical protein WCS88_01530 [Patescibacteria group bacterium]|jgi:hypothetical protein
MHPRIKNWYLLFFVGAVSVVSIALIQQYAMAQWTDPNALPGETANNRFVVNPLKENLQLGIKSITGTDLTIDGSSASRAIIIDGDRELCFGDGTGVYSCKTDWPSVTGGLTGAGDVGYIPQYIGANELGNSKIKEVSSGRYKLDDGSFWIRDFGQPYNALSLDFANPNISYSALNINNSSDGDGGAIRIIDSDNGSSTSNRSSIFIRNGTNGNSLYINDTGQNYDDSPFVLTARGRMGLGTSTPNPTAASDGILHIQTQYANAELDIQSGWNSKHWGIYQDINDQSLRFWHDSNKLTLTNNGYVGIGTINPQAQLDVLGTGRFDNLLVNSSISANTLLANQGFMTELTASTLTAEDGLVLNTPSITMNSTSGDSCTVELVSDRINPNTSGAGHFNIVCYAPTNVCGNSIVEPTNGEECDPVGSVRYSYDISEAGLYNCSAYSTFNRAKVACETACLENSAVCQCRFRCISEEPPHEEYYVIDNCTTPGPTACANGWGS